MFRIWNIIFRVYLIIYLCDEYILEKWCGLFKVNKVVIINFGNYFNIWLFFKKIKWILLLK